MVLLRITDNHKHPPPLDIARVTSSTLPKFEKHPYSWTFTSTHTPLGHCLCDVIIHIPKGLICSFLWPIFSSCFARISPSLPEFHPLFARIWGGSCPPLPPPRLIRLWGAHAASPLYMQNTLVFLYFALSALTWAVNPPLSKIPGCVPPSKIP